MEKVWFVVDWVSGDVMFHGPFGYDREAAAEYARNLAAEMDYDPEEIRLTRLELERP